MLCTIREVKLQSSFIPKSLGFYQPSTCNLERYQLEESEDSRLGNVQTSAKRDGGGYLPEDHYHCIFSETVHRPKFRTSLGRSLNDHRWC